MRVMGMSEHWCSAIALWLLATVQCVKCYDDFNISHLKGTLVVSRVSDEEESKLFNASNRTTEANHQFLPLSPANSSADFHALLIHVNTYVGDNRTTNEDNKSLVLGYPASTIHCPAWYSPCGSGCCCGPSLNGIVRCNNETLELWLHKCYCMTYDPDLGLLVGGCKYNCFYPNSLQFTHRRFQNASVADITRETCGLMNREGRLCGRCKEGHRVTAYSYDLRCYECKEYNWVAYFAVAFVPLTVFYLIVLGFKISAASPLLNTVVQVCQAMSTPSQVRVMSIMLELQYSPTISHVSFVIQVLFALSGIWNLDFFRTVHIPICLPLSTIQSMALDYLVAFYPLMLVVLTYILIELHAHGYRLVVWLWYPFKLLLSRWGIRWNITTSIVDAFVTFILLSYVKLLSISFDLLLSTEIFLQNGQKPVHLYLSYDATVEDFGQKHLPFAILAIAVLVVFITFPLLLLFLYPMRWFQRCLHRCRLNCHFLRMFIDVFQGWFKDGTDGTRDCRYVAGLYLLSRIICFVIYGVVQSNYLWSLVSYFLLILVVIIVLLQPYKNPNYSKVDVCFIVLLSVWFSLLASTELAGYSTPQYVSLNVSVLLLLMLIPQLYLGVLLVYTLYTRCSQLWIRRRPEILPLLTDSLPHRLS